MSNVHQIKLGQPNYLCTDIDPLFRYQQWQTNLRIYEIKEIKSIPFTPQSHPFIERLISTVQREYLDHTVFWSHNDLQQKLDTFKDYYNDYRVHAGLKGKTQVQKIDNAKLDTVNINDYSWKSHCRGLFQTPVSD